MFIWRFAICEPNWSPALLSILVFIPVSGIGVGTALVVPLVNWAVQCRPIIEVTAGKLGSTSPVSVESCWTSPRLCYETNPCFQGGTVQSLNDLFHGCKNKTSLNSGKVSAPASRMSYWGKGVTSCDGRAIGESPMAFPTGAIYSPPGT
jgi:hypothetical protein